MYHPDLDSALMSYGIDIAISMPCGMYRLGAGVLDHPGQSIVSPLVSGSQQL